jgi:hypothetical protein
LVFSALDTRHSVLDTRSSLLWIIFKYYTAYKLMLDLEETQKKARATIKPSN